MNTERENKKVAQRESQTRERNVKKKNIDRDSFIQRILFLFYFWSTERILFNVLNFPFIYRQFPIIGGKFGSVIYVPINYNILL